jgi:hypothetical protein
MSGQKRKAPVGEPGLSVTGRLSKRAEKKK